MVPWDSLAIFARPLFRSLVNTIQVRIVLLCCLDEALLLVRLPRL
jgi:hypothetical protein